MIIYRLPLSRFWIKIAFLVALANTGIINLFRTLFDKICTQRNYPLWVLIQWGILDTIKNFQRYWIQFALSIVIFDTKTWNIRKIFSDNCIVCSEFSFYMLWWGRLEHLFQRFFTSYSEVGFHWTVRLKTGSDKIL